MPGVKGMHRRVIAKASTRARIWQSIRILRRFTLPDLVATAEANHDNARKFVQGLARVGYLRVAKPKQNGRKGGHQVWMLIRDTGPHPPRLQSDGGVWDPNTHTVHREETHG